MTDEVFENHVKALATRRLELPKKLSSQNSMYWGEIISQQYNFDRDNIEVAYLRTITKEQILNFYKVITLKYGHCIKLELQIVQYFKSWH